MSKSPPRKPIPIGTVFGRLTVMGDAGWVVYGTQGHRYAMSHCKCVCGRVAVVANSSLTRQRTLSCGCLKREVASARLVVHGQNKLGKRTSEYTAWANMISRTTLTGGKDWAYYGGRGVLVCDEWLNSFEAFFNDMGPKPTAKHSIDRIDCALGYYMGNCRWATATEQSNNRSNNVRFTFYGMDKTVAEWARITLVPASAIHDRLKQGWPPRFAVWAAVGSRLKDLKVKYPHHLSALHA